MKVVPRFVPPCLLRSVQPTAVVVICRPPAKLFRSTASLWFAVHAMVSLPVAPELADAERQHFVTITPPPSPSRARNGGTNNRPTPLREPTATTLAQAASLRGSIAIAVVSRGCELRC